MSYVTENGPPARMKAPAMSMRLGSHTPANTSDISMFARRSVTRTSQAAGRKSSPTLSNVYLTIYFWVGSTQSVTSETLFIIC